eukprot:scaffold54086_cov27-Tisochrysis_lutea.AAC.7
MCVKPVVATNVTLYTSARRPRGLRPRFRRMICAGRHQHLSLTQEDEACAHRLKDGRGGKRVAAGVPR